MVDIPLDSKFLLLYQNVWN